MAPPTDYSTIYTTLVHSKEIANIHGHISIPAFFDMGLLTKALEITWAWPDELAGVLPCEGGMHLMIAVMAGISKLYGEAGQQDLLQESGVFAAGTMQQILNGKDFADFKEHGLELSATFRFWDDYLQKVSICLKVFISATRNGGWAVYQSAKAKLLPLLFASIRNTYAKYMPVLLLLMKRLPPEVISDFVQRQFVAKLTPGKFNCTWMDFALESTENRALKGIGGIIGLTLRGPALGRWFLSRPVTAKYSAVFADMCHNKASKSKDINHHSASKAEIKRWNADINKMEGMFNKLHKSIQRRNCATKAIECCYWSCS